MKLLAQFSRDKKCLYVICYHLTQNYSNRNDYDDYDDYNEFFCAMVEKPKFGNFTTWANVGSSSDSNSNTPQPDSPGHITHIERTCDVQKISSSFSECSMSN